MSDVLDARFIRAMDDLFGEFSVEQFGEKNAAKLREVWDRARLTERHAVFKFMRDDWQTSRCEDKEWANQISWVIGNGTYLTKCDLSQPLSWSSPDETVILDGNIKDQLQIRRAPQDPGHFFVDRKMGNEVNLVAHIYIEEDEHGLVHHRVEMGAPPAGSTRICQTWESCIHTIVAWVRVRQ
jgi:hypothetical protein